MPYDCFADEIAIDFPSVGHAVERLRDRFLGEPADAGVLRADVSLSRSEARYGLSVPVDVAVPTPCTVCGGRGEAWSEPCAACGGVGETLRRRSVSVRVPRGITDGASVYFRLTPPDAASVRVELRVAVRSAVR